MSTKLPKDDPAMWANVPLEGHICCMSYGNEKHYWTVEHLIELSSKLSVEAVPIMSLIDSVRRGKWFGPNQVPTIGDILDHIERAMNAETEFPVILSADGRVMDGSHRIVAAKIRGDSEIRAVRFLENPAPQFVEFIEP